MNNYSAIIFDLDGTLLDTAEDLGGAMNAVLSSLGYPIHDDEKIRSFIGKGLKEFVMSALPQDKRTDDEVAHCYEQTQKEYRLRWKEHTKLYPEISELLDALTEKNILLNVLSNKEDEFTKEMVATLLTRWHFTKVVGSSFHLPPKPDPTLAIQICKDLNMSPLQFLYVGDSDIDMETAKISGMYAVWARWGYGKTIGYSVFPVEHPLEIVNLL